MSSKLFQVRLNQRDTRLFRTPESQPTEHPINCGAVSGLLLGLITPKLANELTQLERGQTATEWETYLSASTETPIHFNIIETTRMEHFFRDNLFPGFATFVAVLPAEQYGHAVVVAKSQDNRLAILDPQWKKVYMTFQSFLDSLPFSTKTVGVFLRDAPRTPKQHETDYMGFLAKALETCNISSGEVYMDEDIPQSSKDVVMEGTGRRKRRKTKRRSLAKRTLRRVNRRRRIL